MTTDRHARFMALLLGTASVCAVLSTPAVAQERQRFDIRSQDAAGALNEYARQAGVQIVFPYDRVRGRTTPNVQGDLTRQEALAMLTDGMGLTVTSDAAGMVTLRDAAAPQSGSAAGDGADGTVEALIVTAQKREEDIQDVPIAISAFSQEDLTTSQIATGADLMTQVPNMTFTKTNFSGYSIQIRGIGTQAISATTDPAVAVAFNNTPFIRNHFFEQEFYDLQRVEVLRGPQGTLYGRNATAGVVNIISAQARLNDFEAKASADIANYKSSRVEGMINLPLVEGMAALRIAGAWTKREGFVKNLLTGQQTDGRDLWSARVTLSLAPTDRFSADLIYEHFSENDDRLRSGKQLCHKDPGPSEINGIPMTPGPAGPYSATSVGYYSQGCLPASLYSPDSFQTPNGYSVPYYGAAAVLGSPIYGDLDPYASEVQSRDLREIETHIRPEYEASNDTVELQLRYDINENLTLYSETGFASDYIFSFEDYNRFDTVPGVFLPGTQGGTGGRPRFDIVSEAGVFCDPQLGCSTRLAAGDLATATSRQFSQEFRLSSDYEGRFNFNLGANFLRYDTEDKYYVFINTLTAFAAQGSGEAASEIWIPGVTDNRECFDNARGWVWSNPNRGAGLGCAYIDPNNIHNLNDNGRNYFLSRNPYHLLSYAAFGEVYYNLTPELKVTGGFRWTIDRKTAPQIPGWLLAAHNYGTPVRKVVDQEWNEPTGRVAIDWTPTLLFTDQTLLYASYVHGYKAGGANPPPSVPVFPPVEGFDPEKIIADSLSHPETFEPEFVEAYEIGTKNTLLDGTLTLNLNAFYYDYTGYQISQIMDRSAVNLNFDAKIWGSEVEIGWQALENLRFGFKGGYEHTRLADGSRAVDMIDRTAGDPNYYLKKPFPTFPSNCIFPVGTEIGTGCEIYKNNSDNPLGTPNNGQGIYKDLSGNELPNAPSFTATITADLSLPLSDTWLATLHTDLYYQSEAWTRVFNTEGYDKLKAYNNINFAAIFSNEDAGWVVMAYVKNVLDRDSITGAFLNSDDTGLTTNVFLTEPRLYGLRVTKQWSGGSPIGDIFSHTAGQHHPYRLEISGSHGPATGDHEIYAPAVTQLFASDFAYPFKPQDELDWMSSGGAKLTYAPVPDGWSVSVAARYGKATGEGEGHGQRPSTGVGCHERFQPPFGMLRFCLDVATGDQTLYVPGLDPIFTPGTGPLNDEYFTTSATNEEAYAVADLMIGRDVGLGSWFQEGRSRISAGLRYGQLKSISTADLHGVPDFYIPPEHWESIPFRRHRFSSRITERREFKGAGPAVEWEASVPLLGDAEIAGRLDVEAGLGGALLYGKQSADITGQYDAFYEGKAVFGAQVDLAPPINEAISEGRSRTVTVPTVNAIIGLSYTLGNVKVSGGYRAERFFKVIDAGIAERKTYDRTVDGVYAKIAIEFGG